MQPPLQCRIPSAGEIVTTVKEVTKYQPGDQVYGYTGLGMWTYVEYICLPEKQSGMAGKMAQNRPI